MLAKDLFVFSEAGVREAFVAAAVQAAEEVLAIAGNTVGTTDVVAAKARVKNMGCWRDEDGFVYDGELHRQLIPYASVDWYITNALQEKAVVSGRKLMDMLRFGPFMLSESDMWASFRHRKLVIIQERLTHPLRPDLYVQGCVRADQTVVVTTYGFDKTGSDGAELLKTVVLHKLGHLFGLISELRHTEFKAENGAVHCINLCVMRQEGSVDTLHRHTVQRMAAEQPFCDVCARELRRNYSLAA